MPFRRRRADLRFTEPERSQLEAAAKSRAGGERRALRAVILLESLAGQADTAIARLHHVSRTTVARCVQKCLEFGLETALGEWKRPGKPRQMPDEAIDWVRRCARQAPAKSGYSDERWSYGLLTAHVREHCAAAGYPALAKLSRSKLHKVLNEGGLSHDEIQYLIERRHTSPEAEVVNVLHVYQEVEIINDGTFRGTAWAAVLGEAWRGSHPAAGDRPQDRRGPSDPRRHRSRDGGYQRVGAAWVLAGLDLDSGRVIETIRTTHNNADFIEFLKSLEGSYPARQGIRLVLDGHSTHYAKETREYLAGVPQRFVFVFAPMDGAWLNLIENLFDKITRAVLRGIRGASKEDLIEQIQRSFLKINDDPVVARWKVKAKSAGIVQVL